MSSEYKMPVTRVREIVCLLADVDSDHITEDFLNTAMQCNDGCAYWWTVCGRTLVSVEVSEDGFVATVKSELAKFQTVCEVPLRSRSQLLCLLHGLGFK